MKPTPKAPAPTTKAAPAEHADEAGPVRTCVGCRRRAGCAALVRITRGAGTVVGEIVVDGPTRGRGAWICRAATGVADPRCVAAALKRRAFERAWRGPLGEGERSALGRLARGAAEGDEHPDAR